MNYLIPNEHLDKILVKVVLCVRAKNALFYVSPQGQYNAKSTVLLSLIRTSCNYRT